MFHLNDTQDAAQEAGYLNNITMSDFPNNPNSIKQLPAQPMAQMSPKSHAIVQAQLWQLSQLHGLLPQLPHDDAGIH